jgi:predicted O-methyltransferase YrrM
VVDLWNSSLKVRADQNGMPEGSKLDAIEQKPTVAEALTATLRKAGLERRVRILRGEALHILPKVNGPCDIFFIDATKDEYPDCLEEAFRLTRPGSVILAHKVLLTPIS